MLGVLSGHWPESRETAARRQTTTRCAFLANIDLHCPNLIDGCNDVVARPNLADAFGRAGEDHVAGVQRIERRRQLDQFRNAEDHIASVRALALLAID